MKKYWRFLSLTTILVVFISTIIGVGTASAQTVCGPATPISVPFTKDGPGTFCYQATSMCYAINSWSMTSLQINGNNYTNMWVSGPAIPALNGVYTITYNGGQFGHFEITGPCSGGNPTATRTPTQMIAVSTTPALTATRTRTATNGPSLTRTRTATRTPTLAIPTTPVFTLTRTPTPGQGISLKVQYRAGNTNASTTAIQPMIRIINTGSVSVPLRDIGVQYWYTWNGTQPHDFSQETVTCISTTIPGGCASVENDLVPLNPTRLGADSMMVNIFQMMPGTEVIAPGQSYDIEYRITKNDSSLYNQTDDYSFNASFTTYTDWPKITIFHQVLQPSLIWGVEPIVPTPTITPGPSPTATLPGGICSPVTATIAAPFVHDGPITACWKTNNIGVAINSFNNTNVSVNGMNISNQFVALANMPPQINGFWYISQVCTNNFCHFELMDH
jgi:hypothetical protein